MPGSRSGIVALDCFLVDAFDAIVLRFKQVLKRNVGVGEILPVLQKKTKVVVSVGREGLEEGLGQWSRCFGHGGDARDGFVGFYTAKRATDGLVFQILNSRNCDAALHGDHL